MEHKDQRYYLKKELFIPCKAGIDFSFQGRHKGLDICFNIIQMKKTWERGRKIIILMLVNLLGLQKNESELDSNTKIVAIDLHVPLSVHTKWVHRNVWLSLHFFPGISGFPLLTKMKIPYQIPDN